MSNVAAIYREMVSQLMFLYHGLNQWEIEENNGYEGVGQPPSL